MDKLNGVTLRSGGFSFGVPAPAPVSSIFGAPSISAKPAFGMAVDTNDATSRAPDVSSTERTENKSLFTLAAINPNLLKPLKDSKVSRDRPRSCRSQGVKPHHLSSAALRMLESQWRNMEWTEEQKMSLMETVSSYIPSGCEVTQTRVLLLGPVGSGKSSFVSSVQSVFNGRVTNRAMVGSSSTSFTKKLQSFNIHQKGEGPTGLVLCDIMGLGDGEMTGLTLHDILSVIKGHVPDGHKFCPDQPVTSETMGYVKRPSLKDQIHCVAFVVDASKILTYPKGLSTTFQQLRQHISDLGVHQVALLTHIDEICPETAKDVTQVYKSQIIRDMMRKAGALLGMSTSHIVPVKNYSSELHLDMNTDVLLLSAVDHILQYVDLYFQDNTPQDEL